MNFAAQDAEHRDEWRALVAPTGIGMILRSIKTDYKFVSIQFWSFILFRGSETGIVALRDIILT